MFDIQDKNMSVPNSDIDADSLIAGEQSYGIDNMSHGVHQDGPQEGKGRR